MRLPMPFSRTVPVPFAAILAPDQPVPRPAHERLVGRQDRGVEVDYGVVVDGEFYRRRSTRSQGEYVLYFR
jgi:hypothetical protein